MNIHQIYSIFSPYFRKKRTLLMKKLLPWDESKTIIDIGGHDDYWNEIEFDKKITCLNLSLPVRLNNNKFNYIKGNACNLPIKAKSFDIAFSNSVIEHVGSFENQKQFANEIKRISEHYWIQTPNRYFFIEPHLIVPFIHFLPDSILKKLVRYCTIWGLIAKPDKKYINQFFASTNLLTPKDLKRLFPEATIIREKFLFMTKSTIAYK